MSPDPVQDIRDHAVPIAAAVVAAVLITHLGVIACGVGGLLGYLVLRLIRRH